MSGQVEAERGVDRKIATAGRCSDTAPQIAMDVHDLVSLFDPAVLTLMEAIPVTHRGVVDVAIGPAAGIQCDLVRATGVTLRYSWPKERSRSTTETC